jgi:hypothetical protein
VDALLVEEAQQQFALEVADVGELDADPHGAVVVGPDVADLTGHLDAGALVFTESEVKDHTVTDSDLAAGEFEAGACDGEVAHDTGLVIERLEEGCVVGECVTTRPSQRLSSRTPAIAVPAARFASWCAPFEHHDPPRHRVLVTRLRHGQRAA